MRYVSLLESSLSPYTYRHKHAQCVVNFILPHDTDQFVLKPKAVIICVFVYILKQVYIQIFFLINKSIIYKTSILDQLSPIRYFEEGIAKEHLKMGVLDGYLPIMVMIGLQFHYALLAMFTRAALLDGLTPTVFVVYRQGIATLSLAPIIFSSYKRRQSLKTSLEWKSFSLMFMTSLIGVTANQNAYFSGLFYASSTAATAMSNLIPALTFVFAAILGFEKINLRSLRNVAKILGTICCVSGALTMAFIKGHKLLHMEFFLPDSKHLTASGDDNWILGCLLLLASSVFWSCWMIMQVPISSYCPDHILSTFWMCLFATIQSAIFALLKEQNLQAWILPSPLQISCSLYAGIGIAVSFFIQSWCISERGPLYCAMFNPLATVITALVAATFLEEELYVGSLVGAFGVITGLYIVLWGKAKDFDGTKQKLPQSNMEDDERSNRIDLEEPLLAEKSEYVAEIKMER